MMGGGTAAPMVLTQDRRKRPAYHEAVTAKRRDQTAEM